MSPKKNHPNWNVTKTEMSQKLKCHEKTDVAPKLKCYQSWNFTLSKMLQNLKISSKWNLNHNQIQEIGTDHLGLVQIYVSSHRAKFLSKTFWIAYSCKLNQTLGEAIQKKHESLDVVISMTSPSPSVWPRSKIYWFFGDGFPQVQWIINLWFCVCW